MRIKEHERGWWECFETFAGELLFYAPNTGETICKSILRNSGVTTEQTEAWLDRQNQKQTAKDCVIDIVRKYLVSNQ